jgi:methylglutaconyl-CoA hydratase
VRIGVAAAIISVPILLRASGSRLRSAFLTGEPFGADFARDVGLVTHVTDDVARTVAELCAGIRMGAPRAVAETKRMLRVVPTLSRDDGFEQMRALSDELFAGPDAAEGMAAFADKRPPTWQPAPG